MITDQDLRAFERYIISDRNLQDSANMLQVESKSYNFLKIMDRLSQGDIEGIEKSEELKTILNKMATSDDFDDLTSTVKLRKIFLQYDKAKTQVEKDSLIKDLYRHLGWSHDHQKPSNLKKIKKGEGGDVSSSEEENEELRKIPCKFEEDYNRGIINEVNLIIANPHLHVKNIHPRFYPKADYSDLNKHHEVMRRFIKKNFKQIDFENPTLQKAIGEFINEDEKKYNCLPSDYKIIIEALGVEDLIKLYNKFKDKMNNIHVQTKQELMTQTQNRIVKKKFYNEFIDKKYEKKSPKERQQIIFRIKEFISSTFGLSEMVEGILRFIELSILQEQNEFDEKLFGLFCEKPHELIPEMKKYDEPRIVSSITDYNTWLILFKKLNILLVPSQILQIVTANFEHFSNQGVDIQTKYASTFKHQFLLEQKTKFDYESNKKLNLSDNEVSKIVASLQSQPSQTYLDICHYNQTHYEVDQEIKIYLNIKNVETVQIKVFEINTDNYYRKNLRPFSTDINLDGLVAKFESDFQYNQHPSNVKHTEEFAFPQFNGRRGLFVFEFIGNGISSRAVVLKGSLTLITKSTIAGQFAFIIDEKREVCKGPYTGVYFDGNFFPSDQQTGRIIIPFSRTPISRKAILINEGFAQLTDFVREDEDYQFRATILLHQESIIMGAKAKILIKPSLTLGKSAQPADLRLLEETKVTIETINRADNITVSKTYEDVKFVDTDEYELEIQVPPNLAEINVTISTLVNVVTKGEKKRFTKRKQFFIENHTNDFEFCEAFLRNNGGVYQYILKGKNGESKEKVPVTFQFYHKYQDKFERDLKTDKEGIIHLGKLKHITRIQATPKQSRIVKSTKRTWDIPEETSIDYPTDQIHIQEDEQVILPFKHKHAKATNLSLVLLSNNETYIENCFSHVKFIENKKNSYGVNYISIKDLKEGLYKLHLKKENTVIMINVYQGQTWGISKDFILTQRMMIEKNTQALNSLRIDHIDIKNAEGDDEGQEANKKRIRVEIGGDFKEKNLRFHAWAFQFFPTSLYNSLTKKLKQKPNQGKRSFIEFGNWKNFYLSNRQLSDENRYVMERKQQEKTIGNFLEKPTMLLKRNLIQETKFQDEKLNDGAKYAGKQEEQARVLDEVRRGGLVDQKLQKVRPELMGFQNFLQHSTEVVANIKPDVENGKVYAEFEMSLDNYSSLLIVGISDNQASHKLVHLTNAQIPMRDISLSRPLDIMTNFVESRRTTNCLKYDKFMIEDITSTDMQIVDSLTKVNLVQKELKKLPLDQQELIDAMLKWPTTFLSQRPKVYSDYCSHEFNVFLKLKDPLYFEQVVKPFISNKIEKTFVDYWLLNIDSAILSFEPSSSKIIELNLSLQIEVKDLNPLEQCLLIHYLINNRKAQRAEEIAQGIKDRSISRSAEEMDRIYDIVLNMNSLNSKPNDGEDILELFQREKKQQDAKKKVIEELKNKQYQNQMEKSFSSQISLSCSLSSASAPRAMNDDFRQQREMIAPDQVQNKSMIRSLLSHKETKSKESAVMKRSQKREVQEECMEMSCAIDEDMADDYGNEEESLFAAPQFEQMQQLRQEQKLTFKELDNTMEYAETHYYTVKQRNESLNLIEVNQFWVDLALHLVKSKGKFSDFISSNFTIALKNMNEIAFVLALIDLPFSDGAHGFKTTEGRGIEIKAASNMVVFLKEIVETKADINKNIMVIHRYFEKDKQEKEVEEFLINEVYACQVIVTNIQNSNINFQALIQIPQGALPLYTTKYQKAYTFSLCSFSTMQTTQYFYFPKISKNLHFPTNISINKTVVAKAEANLIEIKKAQSKINYEDFDDIIASGSIPNILKFMKDKNIAKSSESGFRFQDIYWLCKDQTFFNEGIKILQSKGIYDQTFWSYSIYHKNEQLMNQYLNHKSLSIKSHIGPQFKTSLISVNNDDESQNIFNFLDYYPLVNARAHRVGGMDQSSNNSSAEVKQWILNEQFRNTYKKFIVHLIKKKNLTTNDRLMLVNYLLMQERISEAIKQFEKIDKVFQEKNGEARLQYDYIAAYLDFYICGQNQSYEFKDARQLALKYKNYPVLHWRKLFNEIGQQLQEIDECRKNQIVEEVQLDNIKDSEQEIKRKQMKMASQMNFCIEDTVLNIDYVNISKVKINYYMIDLEILFSKTPFLSQDTQDFGFVQPYYGEELYLDPSITNFLFPIPEDLAKKNLLIELSNTENGIKKIKTYYSALLRVRLIENFGELKVFFPSVDTMGQDTPLPKTYVKVYQKTKSGETKFFKDGYTDMRGRFDYATLSGTDISNVERFAIFIGHDEYGSMMKEAKPPAGGGKAKY